MITPYNILRHEFIGLKAEVVEAKHPGYLCSGTIINETRETITIKTKNKTKKLPKKSIKLRITLPQGEVVKIDGRLLISRPEDRIKKKYRIKYV